MFRFILAAILAMATGLASAGTISCLPSPLGSGSKALIKSVPKGDFAAWYCPGEDVATILVCLKASCGLVGTKRAIATFATNPTLQGLQEAMAPYTRSPFSDPELSAVWLPYAAEIRALGE